MANSKNRDWSEGRPPFRAGGRLASDTNYPALSTSELPQGRRSQTETKDMVREVLHELKPQKENFCSRWPKPDLPSLANKAIPSTSFPETPLPDQVAVLPVTTSSMYSDSSGMTVFQPSDPSARICRSKSMDATKCLPSLQKSPQPLHEQSHAAQDPTEGTSSVLNDSLQELKPRIPAEIIVTQAESMRHKVAGQNSIVRERAGCRQANCRLDGKFVASAKGLCPKGPYHNATPSGKSAGAVSWPEKPVGKNKTTSATDVCDVVSSSSITRECEVKNTFISPGQTVQQQPADFILNGDETGFSTETKNDDDIDSLKQRQVLADDSQICQELSAEPASLQASIKTTSDDLRCKAQNFQVAQESLLLRSSTSADNAKLLALESREVVDSIAETYANALGSVEDLERRMGQLMAAEDRLDERACADAASDPKLRTSGIPSALAVAGLASPDCQFGHGAARLPGACITKIQEETDQVELQYTKADPQKEDASSLLNMGNFNCPSPSGSDHLVDNNPRYDQSPEWLEDHLDFDTSAELSLLDECLDFKAVNAAWQAAEALPDTQQTNSAEQHSQTLPPNARYRMEGSNLGASPGVMDVLCQDNDRCMTIDECLADFPQGNGTDASCSLSSRKPVLSEEFELSSPKVAESSQLHETVPQKMLMYLESSTPGQKEDIEPFREKDVVMDWLKTASPSERCQVASEMPRTWDLSTPEAQQLLGELMRDIDMEHEAREDSGSPFLSEFDRTQTVLCSLSTEISQQDATKSQEGVQDEQVSSSLNTTQQQQMDPAAGEQGSEQQPNTITIRTPALPKKSLQRHSTRKTVQKSRFFKESAVDPVLPKSLPEAVERKEERQRVSNCEQSFRQTGLTKIAGKISFSPISKLASEGRQFQCQSADPKEDAEADQSNLLNPDSKSPANIEEAEASQNIYALMLAHLRRGSYHSPAATQTQTRASKQESLAADSPGWPTQYGSPVASIAESVPDFQTPCAYIPESKPTFSACASTPAESCGSNDSRSRVYSDLTPEPISKPQPSNSSAEMISVMFESASDDDQGNEEGSGSDSGCEFTPTDSSASSQRTEASSLAGPEQGLQDALSRSTGDEKASLMCSGLPDPRASTSSAQSPTNQDKDPNVTTTYGQQDTSALLRSHDAGVATPISNSRTILKQGDAASYPRELLASPSGSVMQGRVGSEFTWEAYEPDEDSREKQAAEQTSALKVRPVSEKPPWMMPQSLGRATSELHLADYIPEAQWAFDDEHWTGHNNLPAAVKSEGRLPGTPLFVSKAHLIEQDIKNLGISVLTALEAEAKALNMMSDEGCASTVQVYETRSTVAGMLKQSHAHKDSLITVRTLSKQVNSGVLDDWSGIAAAGPTTLAALKDQAQPDQAAAAAEAAGLPEPGTDVRAGPSQLIEMIPESIADESPRLLQTGNDARETPSDFHVKKLGRVAAKDAEFATPLDPGPKHDFDEQVPDYDRTMQQGIVLEKENKVLRQELADLRHQLAEHGNSENKTAGQLAEELAGPGGSPGRLIALSDHFSLILAASEVSAQTLQSNLAVAEDRCKKLEAANRACLENEAMTCKEAEELRREVSESRRALSEAQQASTAAEQARNDAELDAEKLRTDLTNLRKQLEHAHGGYKHSPLHVKKIVAQLEAANAALGRSPAAQTPAMKKLEIATICKRISERENTVLRGEHQELQEKLANFATLSGSCQAKPTPFGFCTVRSDLQRTIESVRDTASSQASCQAILTDASWVPDTPDSTAVEVSQDMGSPTSIRISQLSKSYSRSPNPSEILLKGFMLPDSPTSAVQSAWSPLRSPTNFQTPRKSKLLSPADSKLQFFTPADVIPRIEGSQASPSWISPVPLERWNAITDRLRLLRSELQAAQKKLKGLEVSRPEQDSDTAGKALQYPASVADSPKSPSTDGCQPEQHQCVSGDRQSISFGGGINTNEEGVLSQYRMLSTDNTSTSISFTFLQRPSSPGQTILTGLEQAQGHDKSGSSDAAFSLPEARRVSSPQAKFQTSQVTKENNEPKKQRDANEEFFRKASALGISVSPYKKRALMSRTLAVQN